MSQDFKALAAVMLITVPMFATLRPLMRSFISDADFAVRRNVWLGLTLAAFSIPYYWVYVLVATIVMAYGVKRDSNPSALYVFLLLAMVPIGLDVPTFGLMRQFLYIDHLQLLSFVVLLPVAVRLVRGSGSKESAEQTLGPVSRIRLRADVLVLLYLALQIILLLPYESITASMRRVVVSGTTVWLPYYVLSRGCVKRDQIVEVMASFVLAMFVLAPLSLVEVLKGWLLYSGLQDQWHAHTIMSYLRRGGYLRGQVTAGHSIVLGFAMTIGFGFWLYLQSRIASVAWRISAMSLILVGMAMPSARGPWLGALALLMMFLVLAPNRGKRILKVGGMLGLFSALVIASPYGNQIIERLPFIGSLDEGTVTYRQQLAEASWQVVLQNPWFGTPGFLAHLEYLRQGQGIIDLVNAYAGIALSYGVLTLGAFVAFFLVIAGATFMALRRASLIDADLALLGASLVACLLSSLFMIATVNLYLSVSYLMWSMAGLAVAYAQLAGQETIAFASRAYGPGSGFRPAVGVQPSRGPTGWAR